MFCRLRLPLLSPPTSHVSAADHCRGSFASIVIIDNDHMQQQFATTTEFSFEKLNFEKMRATSATTQTSSS
jgi:hypothetical protein